MDPSQLLSKYPIANNSILKLEFRLFGGASSKPVPTVFSKLQSYVGHVKLDNNTVDIRKNAQNPNLRIAYVNLDGLESKYLFLHGNRRTELDET